MVDTQAPEARISAPPPSAESGRDIADEDFLFHLYRGSELLQDDRVHEAKEELEHALTYQPRDAKGQDLLGVVYFRLGLYPRAIQIYETLRNQNPREPSVRLNLALCYLKTAQAGKARDELEALVRNQPANKRAWGYLGLAYERTGEYARAQEAFEKSGHQHMARRVAQRGIGVPSEAPRSRDPDVSEMRQAVSVAFQELDAGELSFSLASPSLASDLGGSSWRAVELGTPPVSTRAQGSAGLELSLESGAPRPPALRTHVTVPAPVTLPGVGATAGETLSPSHSMARSAAPIGDLITAARLPFPDEPGVALLDTSTALVTTSDQHPFAARLEALRSFAGQVACTVMERRARDKRDHPASEPFGGIGAPIVKVQGGGHLVLAARAAHTILAFRLDENPAFVREDHLLGFDLGLSYENGRLSTGGSDGMHVVQMRGTGVVLLELIGRLGAVSVNQARTATVRRDAIVGWLGRLVPRALPPAEAPAGQRGLLSFAGDGTVLVASM